MPEQVNYNQPVAGLNLSSVTSQIKKGFVTDAQNAVITNFDGNKVAYQNEQANEITISSLPQDFIIIHAKNVLELNQTFFWLVKKDNSVSEIGYINHIDNKYIPLIQDNETNKLNFKKEYPIHKVVVKHNNCGTEFYWTDGYNPRRYLDLSDLPYKSILSLTAPSKEIKIDGVLDINKMLVQPHFKIPIVKDIQVSEDGSIPYGAVQIGIQYSNSRGEGYTSVYNVTSPVKLHDSTIATLDIGIRTNKSISFTVDNLDVTGLYDYFNIIILQTVNTVTTPFLLGTYPVSVQKGRRYVYTGNNGTEIQLSMKDVLEEFPYYEIAQDVTTSKGSLIWTDLAQTEQINYQEIWSKVKLYWITYRIPTGENKGYSNPENGLNFMGWMRDEVYPISGTFFLTNGKKEATHPLVGREATAEDLVMISSSENKNVVDIQEYDNETCKKDITAFKPKWKVFNTGSRIGYTPEYEQYLLDGGDPECYVGPYEYGEFAFWESERRYPNNEKIWGSLADKPIRHFKFPDSAITYHHSRNTKNEKRYDPYIYPLGIRIDEQSLTDAIKSSSLTDHQKRLIAGFKLSRGDRSVTTNCSVRAKGMFTNVGASLYDDKLNYYANYPYNDLRPDPFYTSYKIRPRLGYFPLASLKGFDTEASKERFCFYSPDMLFTNPQIYNGEIKIDSIIYGKSYGHFVPVKENAEYKFLEKNVKTAAASIGIASGFIMFAGTFGWPHFHLENVFPGYQKALELFESIAPFTNFGLAYHSIGLYDNYYVIPNSDQNKIRRGDEIKYISDGQNTVEDGVNFNHFRREKCVYIKANEIIKLPHEYDDSIPIDNSRYSLSQVVKSYTTIMDAVSYFVDGTYYTMFGGEDTFDDYFDTEDFLSHIVLPFEITTSLVAPDIPSLTDVYSMDTHDFEISEITNIGGSTYILNIILLVPDGKYTDIGVTGELTLRTKADPPDDPTYESPKTIIYTDGKKSTSSISGSVGGLLGFDKKVFLEEIETIRVELSKIPDVTINDIYNLTVGKPFHRAYILYVLELIQKQKNGAKPVSEFEVKKERESNISCYYGAIKIENKTQWGDINSYQTLDLGKYVGIAMQEEGVFSYSDNLIFFGGDVYITKFSLKTKQSVYFDNMVGDKYSNQQAIDYDQLGVINYPMFWISTSPEQFEIDIREEVEKVNELMLNMPGSGKGSVLSKIWQIVRGIFTLGIANLAPIMKLLWTIFSQIRKVYGRNNINVDLGAFETFIERGYIYHYIYGIPTFFVESVVNTEARRAENDTYGNYYPRVSKWIPDDWLQEVNVPIMYDNVYYYDKTQSKQHHETFFHYLRVDWDETKRCHYLYPNRSIYSDLTYMEETKNNWLVYRPVSYHDFPKEFGSITSVDGLNNGAVLVRYKNHSQLYDAMTTIQTQNSLPAYLGNDKMFSSSPPLDLRKTNSGYAGSQHKLLISTEVGDITIDAMRGQVLLLAGTNYEPLGDINAESWFEENLPFKILKDIPNYNIDNHFSAVGLHGVYDYTYKRVIITKIDYKVKEGFVFTSSEGKIYDMSVKEKLEKDLGFLWKFVEVDGDTLVFKRILGLPGVKYGMEIDADGTSKISENFKRIKLPEIQLGDNRYFEECSWTLSFSFITKSWVSWHSYIPNCYIEFPNKFQTAKIETKNYLPETIWTHNKSVTKFNNFYDILEPYYIEEPYAFGLLDEVTTHVESYTTVLKYDNYTDWYEPDEQIFFNKAILYNNQQCTGVLNLIPKNKTDYSKFFFDPIIKADSTDIQLTKSNNIYYYNSIYDIVKSNYSPIFVGTVNYKNYRKKLNETNLDYTQDKFRQKARLRAKETKVLHILDNRDDVKMITHIEINQTTKAFK